MTVWYFPDDLSNFNLAVDDLDGYPLEKYIEIEKEYIKLQRERYPNYQVKVRDSRGESHGFEDHPDRPMRYRG